MFLKNIRSTFVHFFSKVNLCVSQDIEVNVPSTTEHSIAIIVKDTDFPNKRKCLFPYLNENKKVANEYKSKILIELDAYLCEESREINLIFTKKHFCIRVYMNLH